MILVTGATGTIGRPLIDALVSEGAKVRAVTHDPQAARLPAGVEVVGGDPSRPDTIATLLEGVTGLFLHPRAVGIPAAGELLALARRRGVQRVVALSAMNVDDPLDQQPSRYQGDRNKEVEDATVASGLEWVSLRASSFAMNTLLSWGAQIRAGDVVRYPYAAFAEALIHERDLAGVGARALLTNGLVGQRPVAAVVSLGAIAWGALATRHTTPRAKGGNGSEPWRREMKRTVSRGQECGGAPSDSARRDQLARDP